MAKFGHTFLAGMIWIAIAVAVGIVGLRIEGIFGVILVFVGFGFAVYGSR